MPTSRPILAAVATLCLLQGCVTTPPAEAPRAMTMASLLQVRNSTEQNAATYYQLGKFHQKRGNTEAARNAYAQSIGLDRKQIEARNALAVLHAEDGRLDEAKALLMQLVQDYPRVAYLHNNLAYVQLLRGEPDAAIPALKNALALEPDNARALDNLALVQAALIERRNRVNAALGLADAIVGRSGAFVESLSVSASAQPAGIPVQDAPAMMPPVADMATVLEPQSPSSSMYVAQVFPNVIELRHRAPVIVGNRRQENDEALPRPAEIKSSTPRTFRLDVANGNGIAGMALKMRDVLARRGVVTARVSNRKPYNTKSTEIFYLPGYKKEAEQVRNALAANVTLTPVQAIPGMQDVQLVLGRDAAQYSTPADKGMLVAYEETRR